MTRELPAYYHLSPSQIEQLSFDVTIQLAQNGISSVSQGAGENGSPRTTRIAWQEKISRPSKSSPGSKHACIFTCPNVNSQQQSTQGGSNAPRGLFSFRSIQGELDRMHKEDQPLTMAIMAAVQGQEFALCVIKVHSSGLVTTLPALSQVEPEDCDDNRIFVSRGGREELVCNGPRLTTYLFSTSTGSTYEYTIEWKDADFLGHNAEHLVAEQSLVNSEIIGRRRELIRKEFEAYDCMYQYEDKYDTQAHIEIISATGFEDSSNLLLCAPHGSSVVLRYKVVKTTAGNCSGEGGEVLLKGTTSSVLGYSTTRASLEFVTYFAAVYFGVAFTLLLAFGNDGRHDLSLPILLASVPLGLIVKAEVVDKAATRHINQQFSILYNQGQESRVEANGMGIETPTHLILELTVYKKNNFGLTSLAGCGSVNLPSKPGKYEIVIPTWKPIANAASGVSEANCRLFDFYLGSCLSDIGPLDDAPLPGDDIDTAIKMCSKGGLVTDGSGSIHVRINTTPNYFKVDYTQSFPEESHKQNVIMRETVDQVLSRVRKQKRVRMSRVANQSPNKEINPVR